MIGEKARWELHEDSVCCFKEILEAALYKKILDTALNKKEILEAAVYKEDELCWKRKNKLISDILLWTPTHGLTSVG